MSGVAPAGVQPVNVGAAPAVDRRLRLRRWYRGTLPPGRSSPLDLLMIQPTAFCNIDCTYCYLPNRSNKGQLPLELLDALFGKLDGAGLIGEQMSVLWHAGEPMVLPPAWYAQAIDRIGSLAGSGARITHFIQTNGTLISQEWCDLVRARGIRIGVSIDGPQHIHDANRLTRSRRGTFEDVMKGIGLLRQNRIPFSVIAVVTAHSVDQPDEVYEFLKTIDPVQTGFNIDEIEGSNASSSLQGRGMQDGFRRFMDRILQLSLRDRSHMRMREVSTALARFSGSLVGLGGSSQEANPFAILSCDVEGRLFTFSPELVDLRAPDGGDFSIGDVRTIDFDLIYQDPRFARLNAEIQAGVARCRASCGYFPVCGGGAPVNKLAENGTFDSTETLFCRCKYMVVTDVVDEHIMRTIAQHRGPTLSSAELPDLEAGRLVRGLAVLAPHAPATRLRISDGTGGREIAADAVLYEGSACLPLASWRVLSLHEWSVVASQHSKDGTRDFVAIVRPPAAVIDPALRIASEMAADGRRGLDGTSAPLIDRVGAELARLFAEPGRGHRTLGIAVNAPGLLTTTVDAASRRRLGLHVDNWSGLAPRARAQAPNRLCVNLGKEPRRLLFLNLSLGQILPHLPAATVSDLQLGATHLARLFMERFPRYPVLSLAIEPGEAYIAPTENLVHDGCTVGASSPDVCLTVLGYFMRSGNPDTSR